MNEAANLPLPFQDPAKLGLSADRLNAISELMNASVASGAIPGAVTLVARKGEIAYAQAFGYSDVEKKKPLELDSLFRMYSQTKPMTAALAMRLYEKGVLLLDSPITTDLPEFSNLSVMTGERPLPSDHFRGATLAPSQEVPACRDITVRDLLTMTSGMSVFFPDVPAAHLPTLDRIWKGTGFHPTDTSMNDLDGTYEEMVLAMAELPLVAHPGRRWRYGSDFDVLTLYLERITGQPIDELFRRELFEPLGIRDTDFYCAPGSIERLTTEYTWNEVGALAPRDLPESSEKASNPERKLMSGNGIFGGVLSTAGDYLRFTQMLLDNGHWNGQQVLGRKTIDLMTTDHIPTSEVDIFKKPGYGFGFGVAVRRTLSGSHTPGTAGEVAWGGAGGTSFFIDPKEELIGLFFTHVFGYQFHPTADLYEQFQARVQQALL